jgi:uncharacterized membrane protein
MKGSARPSRGRVLRPAFEWMLLIVSLVTGLGVIGACAVTGSGGAGAGLYALNILGGLVFAIVLVGAVYLLTTMSRDLRRLREHYVDDAAVSATRAEAPASEESTRADI